MDLYTHGHSERVSRGAVMIGQEIRFLDEALAGRIGLEVDRTCIHHHCTPARFFRDEDLCCSQRYPLKPPGSREIYLRRC
jgi:hypothetical protein